MELWVAIIGNKPHPSIAISNIPSNLSAGFRPGIELPSSPAPKTTPASNCRTIRILGFRIYGGFKAVLFSIM